VQIKAEYNQPFEMKPVKKSGNAPWARIASGAQPRRVAPLLFNAHLATPARRKRCVPGFASYSADCNGLLFAQPSVMFKVMALILERVGGLAFA